MDGERARTEDREGPGGSPEEVGREGPPQARRSFLGPLWRLARALGAGYVALAALAYVFQRRLQYLPSRGPVPLPSGPRWEGLEEFRVQTADGLWILGWYWPGGDVDLLIFHGNAGHRGHRLEWLEELHSLGFGLCMIDYRGYGGSEGSPTERGLYLDAEAALSWLRGRGAKKIVYMGESLGTAVAVELARRHPPSALILESGFSSARDVGQRAYPFLPVRALLKDGYDSIEKIGEVTAPILCIHGTRDSIAPMELARKLYESAPGPKEWYEVAGAGHNDLPWVGGRRYFETIRDFVRRSVPAD